MKTIFIVNPEAGQGKNIKEFINEINTIASNLRSDVEVYTTKCVGDARNFTENYCKNNGAVRFIACGGDGTLNEVINGAIEFENAEIGVIPLGTGNDFCKNFDKSSDFKNISSQILGKTVKCDAIKYKNDIETGYCVNMFNIGFDCNVADLTADIKKRPLISGPFAYFLSIIISLIKKSGADLKIELDGEIKHDGALLLTSIANGSYCGGGIMSNPLASFNDGSINVNIIRNISRLKFISLLPAYMKGTFLKMKNINSIISSLHCKNIIITPKDNKMRLCIDGEIKNATKTEFNIIHNAFNFVVPK